MKKNHSILVVDDDIVAAELLPEVLTREGYSVEISTNGKDAISLGKDRSFDVVITDIKMPEVGGLDVLNAFKKLSAQTSTIVITAFGSFETAVEAIRNGAYDYITKPFKMDEIKEKIKKCVDQKKLLSSDNALKARDEGGGAFKTIIGNSSRMLEVYKIVARAATSDVPVLIQGESGTGKELIAPPSTTTAPARQNHTWPSAARRFQKTSLKASSSDT